MAQNQNMRRLLQEVAQLRVQLISARKVSVHLGKEVWLGRSPEKASLGLLVGLDC